jgi:hypothetical protein
MKRLCFFFILFSRISSAQLVPDFHRIYNDSVPAAYQINHAEIREIIFSKFPSEFHNKKETKACYEFSDLLAMSLADEMESGRIYSDWNDLENYLNAIAKLIIPKYLMEKQPIHVFVSKNGNLNAFSFPSGGIVFNIGLMPFMRDEATIAAILGHEIAHYYYNHSVTNYLENIYGKYVYAFLTKHRAQIKYNINAELEADLLGMKWMHNAGYDVEGALYAQQILEKFEKQYIRKIEGKFKLEETTHPTSERRLNETKLNMSQLKNVDGKKFIISESAHKLFVEESKYEVLNYFLESLNYFACIERAFLFHIFDPENSVYYYYLLEGIRRYCYFESTSWTKNFITDNYYVNVNIDGHKKKNPMESHLFEKFDLEILPIDPSDAMKIKTKNYWREGAVFTTYNEAFNYFCQEGIKYNNPECILSNALSFKNDTSKRNALLQTYLSYTNIKHREFANALKADSLFLSLKKRTMNLLTEYHVDVIHGTAKTSLARTFKNKSGIIYKTAQKSLVNDSLITSFILDDLKIDRMNDYLILKRLESLPYSELMNNYTDLDLNYNDPAFWEIFNKYSVNSIIYTHVRYTPTIRADNSFETLKMILDQDQNALWFDSFDLAYLNMIESKFIIGKNSFINKIYSSRDYKLLKNRDTQGQLQNQVITKKGMKFIEIRK